MILQILILIVGFGLLIKGADIFIEGSSSIAQILKVPKIFIGLTIVSFATSSPELAISIKSIINGNSEFIIANVIGSNIINILLFIGLAAIIKPLMIKNDTINKEIPILLLMTLIFSILLFDIKIEGNLINSITRVEAILLVLLFFVFVYYVISIAKKKTDIKEYKLPKSKLPKSIFLMIVGLVGLIIGGNFVVDAAIYIAKDLGVSSRIIGLTIIALGTSLPELITTIMALIKNEKKILIGNIVGSNIFNIGIVLGLPIVIFGSINSVGFTTIDVAVLLLSTVLLYYFSKSGKIFKRGEGILLLLLFMIYYSYIFIV